MAQTHNPTFSLSLLHPKYWPVWFGFGLLALIVTILPYPAIRKLGHGLGSLALKYVKKRPAIAKRNLELAFPDMDPQQRDELVKENIKNTGLALLETGMAWFWPNWRIRKHFTIGDTTELLELEQQKKGVLVVCVHALNLELTARVFSLFAKGYGVYRAHDNPAYDFIQHWGRTHCGHQMVDRKDVKGMIKVLRRGGRLWYLPDHDYGFKSSVFVPFFAVEEAATTIGSSILIDASRCAVITASGFRKDDHYHLELDVDISAQFPRRDEKGAARVMNKALEKVILRGVDQWMWVHKRFKTMPDDQNKGIRYQS